VIAWPSEWLETQQLRLESQGHQCAKMGGGGLLLIQMETPRVVSPGERFNLFFRHAGQLEIESRSFFKVLE